MASTPDRYEEIRRCAKEILANDGRKGWLVVNIFARFETPAGEILLQNVFEATSSTKDIVSVAKALGLKKEGRTKLWKLLLAVTHAWQSTE